MAATQEMLDQLERAYYSGVRTVQYLDKRVSYKSMDEMLAAINQLKRELGLLPSTTNRYVIAGGGKGLR